MRRGIGISGLQKQAATKETFKGVGQAVAETQLEQFKSQMEIFKVNLEEFAKKHQKDISKNPLLRSHFQKMCTIIGVDPLVSSKGFWAEMLGVGDFYYEVGIQIVESCLVMQEQTGGLNDLTAIKRRIANRRKTNVEISDDDIVRAVKTLKPLGSGYAIVDIGGRKAIQSLPLEISPDGGTLLEMAKDRGYVVPSDCHKWSGERFTRAIDGLIKDGLVWIDTQCGSEKQFWFPAFFPAFT